VEEKSVDEEQSEPETSQLPLDVIFEILKNRRRRRVLHHLKEQEDGSIDLGSLAEHVAALENDKSVAALTSGERKRVYVGLYQCHLPKMNDAGVVDFDRNRGTIEVGENADQLDEYLDVDGEDETPWPRYYLGITLVGAGLFLIGQAGFYPVDWLGTAVVLLMIGALAACAALHKRSLRE
jgi:DNA-binding transcriptional ArsR family regulator